MVLIHSELDGYCMQLKSLSGWAHAWGWGLSISRPLVFGDERPSCCDISPSPSLYNLKYVAVGLTMFLAIT